MTRRHSAPARPGRIDPLTGLDAEDLFAIVEWCQARGLVHPCDDQPATRHLHAEQSNQSSVA